jgi:Zn-dependent protease with chaperone function
MKASTLRTRKEKSLFAVCMILSIILWLMLLISILGVFYGLFFGAIVFVTHALMIAHIRGNGVKLSTEQLPEIYEKVVAAAQNFELARIPDAYVLQAGGALNAFATKFIGRNFIIIYADLLDACSDDGKEAEMIIGHEIGHLALGHLKWLFFLAPARILPWIGAAYSRACEYSCDRCGFKQTGELKGACAGLAILAAGGRLARKMNLKAFVAHAAAAIPPDTSTMNAADNASAQVQAMDLVLNEGYRLARDYSAENGKWPCSLEDLGSRQVAQMADSNGWEMDIDCNRKYIALYYIQDGSTRYRAVMLETGNIESGLAE